MHTFTIRTLIGVLAGEILLTLALPASLSAAEPLLEKVDVFHVNTGGCMLYRIPGIVVTAKGTVLATCEARQGQSDWGTIDILLRRSTDGGRTWGESHRLADVPGPKQREEVRVTSLL